MQGYFIGAEFEYDIDVKVVLEVVQELDDIFILKALVDFDLAHELGYKKQYFQFGALFDECGFLDDFDCEYLFIGLRDELITSGESTFAQEITLEVLSDGIGVEAVIFDEV